MLKSDSGKGTANTITGSLPRPSWYTENLGTKSFLDAMVISRFREQYVDALSVLPAGTGSGAGLDICTDGGLPVRSGYWRSELDQLSAAPHGRLRKRPIRNWRKPTPGALAFPRNISCTIIWKRGHCRDWSGLSDAPKMHYTEIWKAAQR